MGKRNVLCRMGDVPLMSNPADICRECELKQRIKELEQTGGHIVTLVQEVFDMITFDSKLSNAVKEWEKVRGAK